MMMEDSDILTLGWGCEAPPSSQLWHPGGEEFVTLEVNSPTAAETVADYVTLEVAKERDRQFYNSCVSIDKSPQVDWDVLRLDDHRTLSTTQQISNASLTTSLTTALSNPILHTPTPTLPSQQTVTYQEFFIDTVQPQAFVPYPHQLHYAPSQQSYQTYQPAPLPHTTYYTPELDLKRHTVRSPVSGKFVRTGVAGVKRQERKERRPAIKKPKEEREEEAEYDPEVIANAHLTMIEEHYVCSVCKMKFKQPGNARRHIITVHRNEKPHICIKCDARFGRKDKLKTHMMRNHGYSQEDIKATFKHSGQGRQRSSILVNRDNRKSTESSNSDDGDSNPLNLKSNSARKSKHFNTQKKKKL